MNPETETIHADIDLSEPITAEPDTTPAPDDEIKFAVKYNQDIFSMIGGYFHV